MILRLLPNRYVTFTVVSSLLTPFQTVPEHLTNPEISVAVLGAMASVQGRLGCTLTSDGSWSWSRVFAFPS